MSFIPKQTYIFVKHKNFMENIQSFAALAHLYPLYVCKTTIKDTDDRHLMMA